MRTSARGLAWPLAVALLAAWSCLASATDPQVKLAADLQRALDEELAAHGGFGASAAVLAPGLGVWEGAAGFSFGTTPVTSDMVFGVGSITKSFVATLVLRLVEEGVLGLDDSVGRWIPDIPNVAGTITIRQLLNHTSGVADFTKNPAWGPRSWRTWHAGDRPWGRSPPSWAHPSSRRAPATITRARTTCCWEW